MNLDSSIKNFHQTLKNVLSFVRHAVLSSYAADKESN